MVVVLGVMVATMQQKPMDTTPTSRYRAVVAGNMTACITIAITMITTVIIITFIINLSTAASSSPSSSSLTFPCTLMSPAPHNFKKHLSHFAGGLHKPDDLDYLNP